MAKVFLSEWDRACHRMVSWAQGEKKIRHLTDEDLADEYGISRSAMSRRFRAESIDYQFFVFLVNKFQPDNETLRYMIGLQRKGETE